MEFLTAGLPDEIRRLVELGNFSLAEERIKKLLGDNRIPAIMRDRLIYELERLRRVRFDYSMGREEALAMLKQEVLGFSEEDLKRWMEDGSIDFRIIDGEERFFRGFIPNLFRFNEEARKRKMKKEERADDAILIKHINSVMRGGIKRARYRVMMEVKLNSRVEGNVRCWLPFPRPNEIQDEIKLISAHPQNYIVADEKSDQRTIYFEGNDVFRVEYEFRTSSRFVKVDPVLAEVDEGLSKYLDEKPPHICFTYFLRRLSDEITGAERNPYLRAKAIYKWIVKNVRYASAYEYSTYENISDYVARNLKGDCGMQALLFITLARISGIPAKWQSGWYVNPARANMHDWAQFHVKPYGWLHVDPSFGGHFPEYSDFYFGGIDYFRLVFNEDIQSEFTPRKNFIRSDPVDNQRGELEWDGGNLYYDSWKYEFKILKFSEE
ncbi:MAG: transglutaminase-like domain-containing protein [Candidatus Methanodesulfokora sp.]